MKYFKDGRADSYIEVTKEEGNRIFGRLHLLFSEPGYVHARCIDNIDKIWIKSLHRWSEFKPAKEFQVKQ